MNHKEEIEKIVSIWQEGDGFVSAMDYLVDNLNYNELPRDDQQALAMEMYNILYHRGLQQEAKRAFLETFNQELYLNE